VIDTSAVLSQSLLAVNDTKGELGRGERREHAWERTRG